MSRLPIIAVTALFAAAGLAAPAFAASTMRASPDRVPYCSTGQSTNFDSQMETLSNRLQLWTKQGSSIEVWGGCIKVTTLQHGKAVMDFYDPDSLSLVAEIG